MESVPQKNLFFKKHFLFKAFFENLIDVSSQELVEIRYYDARMNSSFDVQQRRRQKIFFDKLRQ